MRTNTGTRTRFDVHCAGHPTETVRRWSDVLDIALRSGWRVSCTQRSYDAEGRETAAVEIAAHHIEADYRERGR